MVSLASTALQDVVVAIVPGFFLSPVAAGRCAFASDSAHMSPKP